MSILSGLSGAVIGTTSRGCLPLPYQSDAAVEALWGCADASVDLALWSLVFTLVALMGATGIIVLLHWLRTMERV